MHSQNCLLDENGPKIDCLTGYVDLYKMTCVCTMYYVAVAIVIVECLTVLF